MRYFKSSENQFGMGYLYFRVHPNGHYDYFLKGHNKTSTKWVSTSDKWISEFDESGHYIELTKQEAFIEML